MLANVRSFIIIKGMTVIAGEVSIVSRSSLGVLCAIAVLGAGEARSEDRTTEPPSGNYRFVDLVLKGAGEKNADLLLRAATRSNRIPVPTSLSVRDVVGELKIEAGTIEGEYRFFWPGVRANCAISATIAPDGAVTGTWQRTAEKTTGALVGRLKTEADLRKENAFTTKADWPC